MEVSPQELATNFKGRWGWRVKDGTNISSLDEGEDCEIINLKEWLQEEEGVLEEGNEIHSETAEVGVSVGNQSRALQWAVRNAGKELAHGSLVDPSRTARDAQEASCALYSHCEEMLQMSRTTDYINQLFKVLLVTYFKVNNELWVISCLELKKKSQFCNLPA